MSTSTKTRRAIGIVRVSQTNGREGDSFASPGEQRDRIRAACDRDGLRLLHVTDELDVSGGTALAERKGLRQAVEAVEAGQADVIVAAYFDRLMRSLRVQDELVSRVEAAGGSVLALDTGSVTNGSAGQWLSGTMLGAVAEYARRTAAERSGEAQERALRRGVAPYPRIPPGYVRGADGVLVVDAVTAPVVAEAFELRAGGATVDAVRTFLADNDITRSYHGVTSLLASRVVLGEIRFGELANLTAHEPIVDREVWDRVQRMVVSSGRRAKSDRLLARLGILRCAACDARMVVASAHNGTYPMYRCPPHGRCEQRFTISAAIVEHAVVDEVKLLLAGIEGTATTDDPAREAAASVDRAQRELDAAICAFAGLDAEPVAVQRLTALRDARDAARDRHAEVVSSQAATTTAVTVGDWDQLTLGEQRDLVAAVIERVVIGAGRGAGRVTITPRTG